jgi:hypothetical protein
VTRVTQYNEEKQMMKVGGRTIAAIVAALLSSILISASQAKPNNDAAASSYREGYSARAKTSRVKSVPTPQTTYPIPEMSPDYHGSNGG